MHWRYLLFQGGAFFCLLCPVFMGDRTLCFMRLSACSLLDHVSFERIALSWNKNFVECFRDYPEFGGIDDIFCNCMGFAFFETILLIVVYICFYVRRRCCILSFRSGDEVFPSTAFMFWGKKIKGLSVEDLEKALMARPAVRCDQVALRILGFSATQWNLLMFLGLFGVSGLLWIKRR